MSPANVTLRDWYVTRAMKIWASNLDGDTQWTAANKEEVARTCHDYADAMLAERERRAKEEVDREEKNARKWCADNGIRIYRISCGHGVFLWRGDKCLAHAANLTLAVEEAKKVQPKTEGGAR